MGTVQIPSRQNINAQGCRSVTEWQYEETPRNKISNQFCGIGLKYLVHTQYRNTMVSTGVLTFQTLVLCDKAYISCGEFTHLWLRRHGGNVSQISVSSFSKRERTKDPQ